MVLSEKTLYSVGRRWVYIFNRRRAKKEIPVEIISFHVLITVLAVGVTLAGLAGSFLVHSAPARWRRGLIGEKEKPCKERDYGPSRWGWSFLEAWENEQEEGSILMSQVMERAVRAATRANEVNRIVWPRKTLTDSSARADLPVEHQ